MSWRRPASAPRSAGGVIERIGGEAIALGTPGEEGGGGKNILQPEGFFDGIDAMMLVYPGMDNIAHSRTVGVTRVQVAYFGKAAHAAARPELGVNALDALLLAINGISALRQQLPSDVRVHSIITKGGTLPQVVPDHTTAVLTVRANNAATLRQVIPRIDACLHGRRPNDRGAARAHLARQAGPRAAEQCRPGRELRPQPAGARPRRPGRATSCRARGRAILATSAGRCRPSSRRWR